MIRKVYWMEGEKVKNFGDILTPKLFDYYSIKYEYTKENYDTICIGSIANKAKGDCMVLGSGIAWENMKLNATANWIFVRGPHTRQAVINSGGNCPEIYGDPALLLPNFCSESKKEYDLGIIPHMKEYEIIKKKYPNHHIINLNNPDPLYIAKEITKCRNTISSSLHGIICSHAYGIPCAWVEFSDIILGDGTKYKDHFASINADPILSTIDNPIFTTGIVDTKKIEDILLSL
jgi:pyruvyltransferase